MPKLPARPERPHVLESTVLTMIRKAVAEHGSGLLWRNNTGKLQDQYGRWVSYGLAIGSADLVGVQRVSLPCPSCGAALPPLGRFFAVEGKQEGARPSEDQETWLRVVQEHGGVAGVARSYEDAVRLVERVRRWP
jgi:hypothetical protein